MLTTMLTIMMAFCLLYGRLSPMFLAMVCIGLGTVLFLSGRRHHARFLMIDVLARSSRLNKVNAGLKFWTVLSLMALCVLASNPMVGLMLFVITLVLVVWVGGLKLGDYLRLLAWPATFLMLSGLALLLEVTHQPIGIVNLRLFGFWFCVTHRTQMVTSLVMARALGAVGCLYLLSLTTSMPELTGVLRQLGCPGVIIDLMYLIYRYVFIMFSMYYTMKDAARSRLGYEGYRSSIRTTGWIYTNLLARSYRQANINYDAMESRCFNGEIRFLERSHKICGVHIAFAAGLLIAAVFLFLAGG